MYLWEYLAELSLGSLQIIAQRLDIESRALPRGRLAGMVDQKLSDRAYLRRMVDRLDEEAQQAFIAALLCGPRGMESAGALMKGLEALLSRGLVYALGPPGRVMCYVVPSDVGDLLRDFLDERLHRELALPSAAEEQRGRSCAPLVPCSPGGGTRGWEVPPMALVRDVFAFLSYVHRHDVQMTQHRRIYKRTLDKIAEHLEFADEASPFQGDHGLSHLDLIVQYCTQRGLVERQRRQLRTTDRFISWLEWSAREQMDDVFAYWLSGFEAQWPDVATAVCGVLRWLRVGSWISIGRLYEVIRRYGVADRDGYAQQRARMAVTTAANGLWHMGMVRWGKGETLALTPWGEAMLQGRDMGEAAPPVPEAGGVESLRPCLFVQPTFEVMVPKMFDLRVRFELERFSTLVAVDQMLMYWIDRESVYRGLEEGMNTETICSFLDRYAKTPIPQNVRYSIEDWGAHYGQISFMDVLLLRTRTPELAEEIRAHPQLRRFVKAEIAPSALVVDRESYDLLLKALRSAGYSPQTLREEEAVQLAQCSKKYSDHTVSPIHRYSTGSVRSPAAFQAERAEDYLRPDIAPSQNGWSVVQLSSLLPTEAELSGEADDLCVLPQRRMVRRLVYALKERKNVLIDYQSEHERLIRKVRPLRMMSTSAMEAYCFSENAQRTFQFARIRRMKVLEG